MSSGWGTLWDTYVWPPSVFARRGLTLSARRHASASKSFGPGALLCWIFFEPRRRGEAIFSSVLCFSEVGRFRPFRDAPKSSLCSTASMRLQLMLQQPAKRIVVSRFSA